MSSRNRTSTKPKRKSITERIIEAKANALIARIEGAIQDVEYGKGTIIDLTGDFQPQDFHGRGSGHAQAVR